MALGMFAVQSSRNLMPGIFIQALEIKRVI